LSAIDDELSIMNKRSIFETLFCLAGVTMRALTPGVAGATGRSRQPPPRTASDEKAKTPKSALRTIRPKVWGRVIVWLLVSLGDGAIGRRIAGLRPELVRELTFAPR